MKLVWDDDRAEGPGGNVYLLDCERVRPEPPAWSVLVVARPRGLGGHRRIRPDEPPWPTKARAKRVAQLDADRIAGELAPAVIRPLRRVNAGAWRSRDGRWTFLRHWSDPHPQRWFAYLGDDDYPANDGSGHVSLRAVAAWAEEGGAELIAEVAGA